MRLETRLFGQDYKFSSLKEVMAKANEQKSGCLLYTSDAADDGCSV